MASTSSPQPSPAPSQVQGTASPGFHTWVLARLDSLLSEELRRGSPSDLVRNRVLAGSSCLLLLLALVGLVTFPSPELRTVMVLLCLSYASPLVMMRRARSHLLPALVLCTASIVGGGTLFYIVRGSAPYFGTHAGLMLQPALAVYLLGARRGLFVALIWAGAAVLFPLYYTQWGAGAHSPPDELLWPLYICAFFSFLNCWGLGSLHSSALTEAQDTLEHTLKELRTSQGQLLSVFESTDDLVFLLAPQGHLITCNSAARQLYSVRYGHEPTVGQPYFPASDPELRAAWAPRLAQALTGQRQRYEEAYEVGGSRQTFDINVSPVHGTEGRITGVTVVARNITAARQEAERRLGEVYRTLVDVSRQAGMAEIATGVLHNVGNTLNSVNVSTTLVIDKLRQTRLPSLAKLSSLLQERSSELGSFLTQDPQGQLLPAYISALSDQLHQEHGGLLKEMRALSDSVEHIKSVISMQQKHARVGGAVEEVYLPLLIDEALRLHAVSFERLGIRLERDYANIPSLRLDRHRLLQILVNLLSNARDALISSETQDKRLLITIRPAPEQGRVLLQVADNGIGLTPENAKRVFSQGFTTKKSGHGFGLHISALAATEMGGQLTCFSPGPGQGATFTLTLPTAPPKES
jgi:PAS domain S-box-containing protein